MNPKRYRTHVNTSQDYTFPQTDRIVKRRDFLHLSNFGEKVYNRDFIIAYQSNEFGKPRIGITVSKRVGGAVTRNRLKRLAREYFRLNRQRIKGHLDLHLIARKKAADLSSKQVFASLQDIYKKLARKSGN